MYIRISCPIFAVVVISAILSSCYSSSQLDEEIERQRKEVMRQQVLELAAKYDADFQWLTRLDKREFYTVELQQLLLEPPGRSYLLLSSVDDVQKKGEAYFLTANDWLYNIYLHLQCNPQQAEYLLKVSSDDLRTLEEYAIVFQPVSVYKPRVQLASDIDGYNSEVIWCSSWIFVVEGKCLDILFLNGTMLNVEDLSEAQTGKDK